MLKRTLFFANPCHLSVQLGQLMIRRHGHDDRTIPIEDLALVFLESPAITFGVAVLQRLFEENVAVVVCDSKHMPAAILLPSSANHIHSEVLRLQMVAPQPMVKRLWRATVQAKIHNQADLLEILGKDGNDSLRLLAREVKSNDADNREGVAARLYWKHLFPDENFVRDRERDGPNSLLNYGYAVLRAATARALVSSGLFCAIGIHHRNRYNAYGLADDIMEPYRPFVDRIVVSLSETPNEYPVLGPAIKLKLLEVLSCDTWIKEERSPLMVALSTTTASLVRCLRGEEEAELLYPRLR